MKLFTAEQIDRIDRYTIENEPVAGIDLMERAAVAMADYIVNCAHFQRYQEIFIFAGAGNNGGDALAIARLLLDRNLGKHITVVLVLFRATLSKSTAVNLQRLQEYDHKYLTITDVVDEASIPAITPSSFLIDGVLGRGVRLPIEGLCAAVVYRINHVSAFVVSIDIPSGLCAEDNTQNNFNNIVRANITLSLEYPKISFLFSEYHDIIGKCITIPVGLHPDAVREIITTYYMSDMEYAKSHTHPVRSKFAHKGWFGHALLIAGAQNKIGAATLAARACMRSGVGLLTCHVPKPAVPIIHTTVPEAMCSADPSEVMFTAPPAVEEFTAVGIGPGIGTDPASQQALYTLLQAPPERLVLDADALNILAMNPEWLKLLPEDTILTPHLKEFERLAGHVESSWERLQLQRKLSRHWRAIIVLKGANTSVSLPSGSVWFNSNGNPGMATAGAGDVLTGIILGLLAQRYLPRHAARLGVFLHGLAGNLAAKKMGQEALIASDIIDNIGAAYKIIHSEQRKVV
ncbi:MAG: NAD(P)H-hydrate dehydratase [Bacteroidales bacterium]|jgi:NAD(P)H-hydrate epimerase|nr:NAD(P)H-hydrate dehydratase [Bacteroidales bacterium]